MGEWRGLPASPPRCSKRSVPDARHQQRRRRAPCAPQPAQRHRVAPAATARPGPARGSHEAGRPVTSAGREVPGTDSAVPARPEDAVGPELAAGAPATPATGARRAAAPATGARPAQAAATGAARVAAPAAIGAARRGHRQGGMRVGPGIGMPARPDPERPARELPERVARRRHSGQRRRETAGAPLPTADGTGPAHAATGRRLRAATGRPASRRRRAARPHAATPPPDHAATPRLPAGRWTATEPATPGRPRARSGGPPQLDETFGRASPGRRGGIRPRLPADGPCHQEGARAGRRSHTSVAAGQQSSPAGVDRPRSGGRLAVTRSKAVRPSGSSSPPGGVRYTRSG